MGTPEFACAVLEPLIAGTHEVLAVVTGPDKPAGRKRALTPTVVRTLAEKHKLPVLMPKSLKDDSLYQSLAAFKADLFVVAAFRILPPRLFELPRLGAINIHASLLPKYRGAAPINWAIINGETETGLTSFYLKQNVDTGDMILQTKVSIAPTDTYDSLHDRLADLAGPFTHETLSIIEQGESHPIAQNNAIATPAPKIHPEDALIDFDQPGDRVADFVRGMATKPGAYTFFRGQKVKVHFAQPSDHLSETAAAPGSILSNRRALLVQCHDSVVELTRVVPAGRKEMDGVSFLNGFRPQAGESFINQGKAE